MKWFSKQQIAEQRAVTTRTVDKWRERGLLGEPVKLGNHVQSRVRWTEPQLAELDKRLSSAA